MKNTLRKALAASALAAFAAAAAAHGTDSHSAASNTPSKEQKAWGIAGDPAAVTRTLEIRMLDTMRFVPDGIEVRQGETLRLAITNTGKIMHELVIGTKKGLDEHAALMMKFPGMEHDEPYIAHVKPGQTGEIVWAFNRRGTFAFACLIPGHMQSGMIGRIRVVAAGR